MSYCNSVNGSNVYITTCTAFGHESANGSSRQVVAHNRDPHPRLYTTAQNAWIISCKISYSMGKNHYSMMQMCPLDLPLKEWGIFQWVQWYLFTLKLHHCLPDYWFNGTLRCYHKRLQDSVMEGGQHLFVCIWFMCSACSLGLWHWNNLYNK